MNQPKKNDGGASADGVSQSETLEDLKYDLRSRKERSTFQKQRREPDRTWKSNVEYLFVKTVPDGEKLLRLLYEAKKGGLDQETYDLLLEQAGVEIAKSQEEFYNRFTSLI